MNRRNDTLGVRIRRARRAAELSQEQLGERLGVTRQTVNRWERDVDAQDGITYARQKEIAEALGVSLSDLLPECSDDEDEASRRRAA